MSKNHKFLSDEMSAHMIIRYKSNEITIDIGLKENVPSGI